MIDLLKAIMFPEPATRETLGRIGGNARFVPPRRDVANDAQHGIAPGSAYTIPSRDRRI